MRDRSKVPTRLLNWMRGSRDKGAAFLRSSRSKWANRGTGSGPRKEFDFRNLQLKNVSEYAGWIRWTLAVLAIFLLSEAVCRTLGLFIRPSPLPAPNRRQEVAQQSQMDQKDYDAILRRNMFNVEGKIPDPLEQGQMDCMSQARPSTQRVSLLGTLVMGDERLSVALIQEEGNPNKIGVKKDEVFFDGKFQAIKVERKRLCFQVRANQEFEYIEIPEQPGALAGPALDSRAVDGITPVSDTEYVVKQGFLEKNLLNLNEILQTARAIPYVEPGTGKFRGFLVQSIDPSSLFSQLGVRQGDILTGVNDIVLDNAGKGLEAFQKLRNSNKISLEVIRSGQKTTMNYDVK